MKAKHELIVSSGGKDRRRDSSRHEQAAVFSPPAHRKYGRWRAVSLIAIYLLMAVHIVHWKINGRTLAPLELNEVLYTLELGIVTAGFIFMGLAVLATAVFGRFFCSWGCHILALQDLCTWLLQKAGIRPKPVRSRVLLLVPVASMVYMFIWPQVWGAIEARPRPVLHVTTDSDSNWASFVTTDFWRNLPGPWVTLLTFLVCGFAIVYVLGSRAFCTYACPYGAIFALADRIAPGKIKAVGDRANCAECGLCTAACTSHIRVHEELTVFGRVVSPACLKDLDCVSVCPNGSITYGLAKPSGFRSWRKWGRFGIPYDFSFCEDILMAGVFLVSLAAFRGLYDAVPFFLTLGIAAILAWTAVLGVRMFTRTNARVSVFQIKRDGRWTRAGWTFMGLLGIVAVVTAHCGFIRWHEAAGSRAFHSLTIASDAHNQASVLAPTHAGGALGHESTGRSPADERRQLLASAIAHLEVCDRWGLVRPPSLSPRLAALHLWNEQPVRAEPHIRRHLESQPMAHEWRMTLAAIVLMRSQPDEALAHLQWIISATESSLTTDDFARAAAASAHEMTGDIAAASDQAEWAKREYQVAADLRRAQMPHR